MEPIEAKLGLNIRDFLKFNDGRKAFTLLVLLDNMFLNYKNVAFPSVPSPGTKSSTSPSSVESSINMALPAS